MYTTMVYRVEHPLFKVGPFQAVNNPDFILFAYSRKVDYKQLNKDCNAHCSRAGLDSPYTDFSDYFLEELGQDNWVCGTLSLASLKKWFPKDIRKTLAELGFQIKVFDVPEYQMKVGNSGEQVLFYAEFERTSIDLALL